MTEHLPEEIFDPDRPGWYQIESECTLCFFKSRYSFHERQPEQWIRCFKCGKINSLPERHLWQEG